MTGNLTAALGYRLPAWSVFGGILAAAGLPIYIYAPPYYAQNFGVSLTGIAAVLFWLRLFDAVQDPVLGWVSERLGSWRGAAVGVGGVILALSMLGLFAVAPPIHPLVWFTITITGLFSAFSFLTINFYGQGVMKAETLPGRHVQLGAWREAGSLLGVCIAAALPTVLMGVSSTPLAVFAVVFAGFVVLALVAMAPEWRGVVAAQPVGLTVILKDKLARRLLILALVNATPVAVSSTLFLFFVESRLNGVGWAGPLLILFFLSGALTAPIWFRLAARFGTKPTLLTAMGLAIASFGFAATLGAGDAPLFAIVCIAAGATIGADFVLLPALFAKRMAEISPAGGQGFGLWSLAGKFTLAFAAIALLPLLETSGFQPGGQNPERALSLLSLLYAGVPCALKCVAVVLLVLTDLKEA